MIYWAYIPTVNQHLQLFAELGATSRVKPHLMEVGEVWQVQAFS